MRRIFLSVRRFLDPIEHLVGRVMDEEDAGYARLFRQHADGRAIDRRRELFGVMSKVSRTHNTGSTR